MSKIWIKGEEITAENLNETAYGLHVVSQDTPNMTVRITSGVAIISSVQIRYTGGNSPTITAPSANPRIDLVVLKQDGTIEIIGGTENASPTAPLYPADKLVLAELYLRTGMTQIKATDDSVQGYVSLDARPVTGVAPSMPVGVIFPFAASSPPAGFILCDGAAISRSTYAALFALISTTYGAGNGSTTFNVPDLRGSVPIGVGQKNLILINTAAYTDINVSLDTMLFAVPHNLFTDDEVVFTSSGAKPYWWVQDAQYTYSLSRVNQTVDGAGNIAIGYFDPADLAVNTKIKVISQSSTNFVAGTEYYIISNSGGSIQVSATQGGSVFGAGNSGSLTFDVGLPPKSVIVASNNGQPTCDGSGNYTMNGPALSITTEPYRVNDKLICVQQSGSSGVSVGQVYYVVSVSGDTFRLSSTLGGSAITSGNNGQWCQFIAYRDSVRVIRVSATVVKFAKNHADAASETAIDLIIQGSGNHTLTLTRALTSRSLAEAGGEETHTLSTNDIPAHVHPPLNTPGSGVNYTAIQMDRSSGGGGGGSGSGNGSQPTTGPNVSSSTPHNIMQPFLVVNYIIKT